MYKNDLFTLLVTYHASAFVARDAISDCVLCVISFVWGY